jgi:hypothetical protein
MDESLLIAGLQLSLLISAVLLGFIYLSTLLSLGVWAVVQVFVSGLKLLKVHTLDTAYRAPHYIQPQRTVHTKI